MNILQNQLELHEKHQEFLQNGICKYDPITSGEVLKSFNMIIMRLKLDLLLKDLLFFNNITNK